MTAITLTRSETFQAAVVATLRRTHALYSARAPAFGIPDSMAWQADIEGALGELAVAKYLNLFWSGTVGLILPGDVGKIEVRATANRNGHLLVHRGKDPVESPYVLVRGTPPDLDLPGWIEGRDAQAERYWTDEINGKRALRGGAFAYIIPARDLSRMDELRRRIP